MIALPGRTPAFVNRASVTQTPETVSGTAFAPLAPLFGTQDIFKRGRNNHVLVPAGTPVFFLHGTSSNGSRLNPMVYWFKREVRTEHPGYVAYLPEVERASGIENPLDPDTMIPAYLAALRELGDFRHQVVHNRLKLLNEALGGPAASDESIAEFFKLRADEQALLIPLIREHILKPIYRVPDGWHSAYRLPLSRLAAAGVEKLSAELNKLNLRADERDMPIYDSEFLFQKAMLEGKRANFEMAHAYNDPDIVNIRSINLRDTALLEGYLMGMQASLGKALREAFRNRAEARGERFSPEPEQRAGKTAEKLMEAIAPRAMTIGHSQGGTVLMAALLNHFQELPPENTDFARIDPRPYRTLSGRGVGLQVMLSAPLKGIPDTPRWGKVIMEEVEEFEQSVPIVRRKEGIIARGLKQLVWHFRMHNAPAVSEMREGSPLTRKIQASVNSLADKDVTFISAFDRNDAYIEPEASLLRAENGKTPANLFNLQLETQQLPPTYIRPEEIWTALIGNVPILNKVLNKILPDDWEERCHRFYMENLLTVEQHQALVAYPNVISHELGRQLLGAPENQAKTLDPSNFEPFRAQALVARSKSFRRKVLGLPTPQAAAALQAFLEQNPQFVPMLIANARENLPVTNSASYAAHGLLTDMLGLMETMAGNIILRYQYQPLFMDILPLLRDADLPAMQPDQPALSRRAENLLKRFS